MRSNRILARAYQWTVGLLIGLAAGGCAISPQQEVRIGQDVRPQFEQEFGGLYPDAQVQQYVQEVGMRVARHAGRPDLPWEFRVLDSEVINAFALPGGYIYISRGLLFNMANEAELAAVLAHEAAHVAHRHSVRQLERAQLLQGGAALLGVATGEPMVASVSEVVAGLAMMSYGRDQEREADLSGLNYMAREGYQPRAMVSIMETMNSIETRRGPPEFLSTHPNPENRLEYLQQTIDQRYAQVISAGRTGEEEFRQRVLSRRP